MQMQIDQAAIDAHVAEARAAGMKEQQAYEHFSAPLRQRYRDAWLKSVADEAKARQAPTPAAPTPAPAAEPAEPPAEKPARRKSA